METATETCRHGQKYLASGDAKYPLLTAKQPYCAFSRTGNGEAKDICPTKGDGNELEIGFNNRYLMEALCYAPADNVRLELNTNISPCVITPVDGSDNFLYMVLPVRLKAQ